MERIEKTIDVDAPVRAVYNQWTQFEEFPRFMAGVKEVRQLDDTHVHWHAEIWGKDKEWDAEITEQEPDKRISGRASPGATERGHGAIRTARPGPHARASRYGLRARRRGGKRRRRARILQPRPEHPRGLQEIHRERGGETGGWRGEPHGQKQDWQRDDRLNRQIAVARNTDLIGGERA